MYEKDVTQLTASELVALVMVATFMAVLAARAFGAGMAFVGSTVGGVFKRRD